MTASASIDPVADPDAYDLVVIGSGPAGEKGAAQVAYFGKRVALIERAPEVGGAGVNTGTLPSKTLLMPQDEVAANRSAWIDEWLNSAGQ